LMDRFNAGDLDLALVKRQPADRRLGTRVWREPLVWAGRDHGAAGPGEGPLALAVSPRPCVYRKRATDALDEAGRPWRIAYTCGSLAGVLAAVRAGLGVTVLPKEMVPPDLAMLEGADSGLPDLAETEIALLVATGIGPAAERLRDAIVRALEHR
ncbi:MAG: LysR substrate-binding domain-containing protein, partial [Alphaproteobacteria bacterium]